MKYSVLLLALVGLVACGSSDDPDDPANPFELVQNDPVEPQPVVQEPEPVLLPIIPMPPVFNEWTCFIPANIYGVPIIDLRSDGTIFIYSDFDLASDKGFVSWEMANDTLRLRERLIEGSNSFQTIQLVSIESLGGRGNAWLRMNDTTINCSLN